MNKVFAEIRIDNIFTSTVFVSKSPGEHSRKQQFDNEMSDTMGSNAKKLVFDQAIAKRKLRSRPPKRKM